MATLSAFVHDRHDAQVQNGESSRKSASHDDLKLVVPKEGKGRRRKQVAKTKVLEGTDPGDFGDETLIDINGNPTQQPRNHQERPYDGSYTGQGAIKREPSDGDYPEGEHYRDDPLKESGYVQQPSDLQRQHVLQSTAQMQGTGIAIHHSKGSTYPSTTSGRPSEGDADQNARSADSVAVGVPQHTFNAGQQRRPRPEPAMNHNATVPAQQSLPALDQYIRPGEQIKTQGGPGFAFGAARQPWRAAHQTQPLLQQRQHNNDSLTDHAIPGLPPSASRLLVNQAQPEKRVEQQWSGPVRLPLGADQQKGREHQPTRAGKGPQLHTANPVQPVEDDPEFEQEYEPISSPDRALDSEQDTENCGPQLDYNEADLKEMHYGEIKAQLFDIDPNLKYQLPKDLEDIPLAGKLENIMGLDSEKQAHDFLTDLPLDDWEQAGEWFIERFSDITQKLVDARKEKRRACVAFEDEIERRYKSIGRKRKETDAALSEMRVSGGKVLAGTPKKPKTK